MVMASSPEEVVDGEDLKAGGSGDGQRRGRMVTGALFFRPWSRDVSIFVADLPAQESSLVPYFLAIREAPSLGTSLT